MKYQKYQKLYKAPCTNNDRIEKVSVVAKENNKKKPDTM